MNRYFLHLKQVGDCILKDDEGSELPDVQAAREKALESARDLLAMAIKEDRDLGAEAVIVADNWGQELFRVPLTAVLPKSLQQGP